MKTQIVVGIILLVLGGLFAKYKIFDDKIELKYSLTNKIPSDFSESKPEAGIQQLTIKNSGDLMINSITIKINSQIIDYKVKKFKSTDSITSSKAKNYLEIGYPELPPLGEVIVLLETSQKGINNSDVQIFHSKGLAKEAFSNNDSWGNWIFLFASLIYLTLTMFGLRNLYSDSLQSKVSYYPYDLLKRKKPWYFKEEKWFDIRKDALDSIVKRDSVFNIENSESYKMLNTDKQDFLSDEEWSILKQKAEEKLKIIVSEKINKSYYDSSFDELSNLSKPKYISYESWKKIYEEVSKGYCTHKQREILHYDSTDYPLKILESHKPEIIEDEEWNKLINIASKAYSAEIILNGILRYNLDEYIDNQKLDALDSDKKNQVIEFFENLKKSVDQKDYYDTLLDNIRELFYWDKLPDKPDTINDDDWNKIEKLFNSLIKTKQEVEKDLKEAQKLRNDFEPAMHKIRNQLELIDNIFKDPEIINRVEDYNIPFEKGNWENLVKLATKLKDK